MPAQRDETNWKPKKGDHADDPSFTRKAKDPSKPATDEQRTSAEIKAK